MDLYNDPRRSRDRSRSRSPARRRDEEEDRRYGGGGSRYSNGPSYRDRDYEDRRGPPPPSRGAFGAGGGYRGRDPDERVSIAVRSEVKATEAAKRSRKECRVYVGNLPYSARWTDLKDHFRDVGDVVFAEIMLTPEGRSRGCGVVEYANEDDAIRAIRKFNETTFLGRPIHVREDRENEARFGMASFVDKPDRRDGGGFGPPSGGAFGGGAFGARPPRRGAATSGPQHRLTVSGLNDQVGWQDLKDLFRQAGDIVRADVDKDEAGRPAGSGYVIFTSAEDARNARTMFDGAELNGMKLEVREERFTLPASGPFGRNGGLDPDAPRNPASMAGGRHIPPSRQIYVKNLPYTTQNDDLIDLFTTTGVVEHAEILFEGGRTKGSGIVQFPTVEEAEASILKFNGYMYGGRPIALEFNAGWREFGDTKPAVA